MEIYLDESGDLGWSLTQPYRKGGSSRYLTIASLLVSQEKRHIPQRLIRDLYTKFNWPTSVEKKWSGMTPDERIFFARRAVALKEKYPSFIKYLSITVKKENVQSHIRNDANKLYNYMIALSLLNEMKFHKEVFLIPDQRSIKVEHGHNLHDYLQTQLWFEHQAETVLKTRFANSARNLNIQFSDMLSGVVQGHFEDGHSEPWWHMSDVINYKTLFF